MKIIVLSEIKWKYLRTRKAHIIKRFPQDWRVLFIEPFTLGKKNYFLPQKEGNISYITVPFFKNIPVYFLRRLLEFKRVRQFISLLVLFWIKALLSLTGFAQSDVIYISNIYYANIARRLGNALILYDCNDDPLAFPLVPPWAEEYFINLCRKADVITVCSEGLMEKVQRYAQGPIFLVGNGVEFSHFAQRVREEDIPSDIREIRKPIFGYIGTLSEWIDENLIEKIVQRYPQASLVFIGPIARGFAATVQKLKSLRNVHFLGEKDYLELPKYLTAMNVCLLPFKRNELIRNSSPNKLYEYFAAGKPVITLDYSQTITQYEGVLFLAKTLEEFVEKVGLAFKKNINVQKLQTIAQSNSWNKKAQEIIQIIEESLEKKRKEGLNHFTEKENEQTGKRTPKCRTGKEV